MSDGVALSRPPLMQADWQVWIDRFATVLGCDSALNMADLHDFAASLGDTGGRALGPLGCYLLGVLGDAPERRRIIADTARAIGSARFDAVVLAGGFGSRLGGVSKGDIELGSKRLLDRVLAACEGAQTTVVVGDLEIPAGAIGVREYPAGTGPAAGLGAGLAAISVPSEWTLVVAVDHPGAGLVVPCLRRETVGVGGSVQAVMPLADGRAQHLLALYRSDALRDALGGVESLRNRGIKPLISHFERLEVPVCANDLVDIDTPWHLDFWVQRAGSEMRVAEEPSDFVVKPGDDPVMWDEFFRRVFADVTDPGLPPKQLLGFSSRLAKKAKPMPPVALYLLGMAIRNGAEPEPAYGSLSKVL